VPGGAADGAARCWIAAIVALMTVPLVPQGAGALGALEHPSVEQAAAGVDGILFYTLSTDGTAAAAPFYVEATEIALYGVAGLRLSGIRAGARLGAVWLVAEAARLGADIGHETRLAVTPAVFVSGRWAASVGLVHECAHIDGMDAAHLTSVTARSLVRLSDAASVGGEVGRYRLCGEANDGADVSLCALVRPLPGTVIRAVVGIGRWVGAQPTVSTSVAVFGAVRLTMGYQAATDALNGAVAFGVGGLGCAAGAQLHPTLGTRHGVAVTWRF
jgi:hypothetical protein